MEVYYLSGGVVCALLALIWDLWKGRIPNRITYSGMVAALGLRALLGGWHGLLDGLVGGLLGGGIFLLFFLVGGMGAGDVKLMTAIGLFGGVRQTMVMMVVAALAGGILAVGFMVVRKRGMQTIRNLGSLVRYHLFFGLKPHPEINLQNPESIRMPYAVAIATGVFYAFAMAILRG
jgi:prepilin peptidase CpaA